MTMTDPDPPRPNFNVYVSATAVKLRRFKIAAGYYALQGNSAVFAWNPEEQLPVEERRIIMPHEFRSSPEVVLVDARVLTALDGSTRTDRLLSLTPRQFEELVAGLLERKQLGYRVLLSPIGPDGGVDIIAERQTEIGPELVVVQCKRYASHKKVDRPTVQQFCTVVDDSKATRGLIVTTSCFTRVALNYIELKKHRVTGVNRAKLEEWMQGVHGGVRRG